MPWLMAERLRLRVSNQSGGMNRRMKSEKSTGQFQSRVDTGSQTFQNHRLSMESLMEQIRSDEGELAEGGGSNAVAKQHAKGRLTARERLELLLDPGSEFMEFGIYTGFEMYREWGGAPAAGVITGVGKICGRDFMIIANDATVKAGSFFP